MEYYIGEIALFPFTFTPAGWLQCNGQLVSIMSYQPLFALLGTTYGGDGRTTFGLPNLTNASPNPNMRFFIAYEGIYPTPQ